MTWSNIRVLFVLTGLGVLLLPLSATAAGSRAEVIKRLPPGNKRILLTLKQQLGLSEDWERPQSRDSSRSLGSVFSNRTDGPAWKALEDHFVLKSSNSVDWRNYWQEVPWKPGRRPVRTSPTGARLLRLPAPQLPSSGGNFAVSYPGPLPGDVVVLHSGQTPIVAVYWGNRRFPKRKYSTSFLYYERYNYGQKILTLMGTTFNSYPPRLTESLFRVLYRDKLADLSMEKKQKLFEPNSGIFKGANGYLATPFRRAYGGYFMPNSRKPEELRLQVLRRKQEAPVTDIRLEIAKPKTHYYIVPGRTYKEMRMHLFPKAYGMKYGKKETKRLLQAFSEAKKEALKRIYEDASRMLVKFEEFEKSEVPGSPQSFAESADEQNREAHEIYFPYVYIELASVERDHDGYIRGVTLHLHEHILLPRWPRKWAASDKEWQAFNNYRKSLLTVHEKGHMEETRKAVRQWVDLLKRYKIRLEELRDERDKTMDTIDKLGVGYDIDTGGGRKQKGIMIPPPSID